MSLVEKILSRAGQLKVSEVIDKISTMSDSVKRLKETLYESLVSKYEDFSTVTVNMKRLSHETDSLSVDIDDTYSVIKSEVQDELASSSKEFSNLRLKLGEVEEALSIVKHLLRIDDHLSHLINSQQPVSFTEVASTCGRINEEIKEISSLGYTESDLNILKIIKQENMLQRENAIYKLQEKWRESVKFLEFPRDLDGYESCALNILSDRGTMSDIIRAMVTFKIIDRSMKFFSDAFMKNIVKPIVVYKTCKLDVKATDNVVLIQVSHNIGSENEVPSDESCTMDILKNILEILDQFSGIGLDRDPDIDDGNSNFLNLLGSYCKDEMLNLLIGGPLSESVPSDFSEMSSYQDTLTHITDFHDRLVAMKFIQEPESLLRSFVDNINSLLTSKVSKTLLERARSLMKSEICVTLRVTPEDPPRYISHSPAITDIQMQNPSTSQDDNLFTFPECMISHFISDLLSQAYTTLYKATAQDSHTYTVKMFYTVRNIFELYLCVVPTYHKQSLQSLPQISAIHYNNCMFLAHHLTLLGFEFSRKLSEGNEKTGLYTFIDLVSELRRLGSKCFTDQLKNQRSILLEILSAARGFDGVSEPESIEECDKCLRQCVYSLKHLRNVWKPVLPNNVCGKALGNLLTSIIKSIIADITSLEDISLEEATNLHSLLSTFKDSYMKIFSTDNYNQLHHSSPTSALTELLVVLNGSLQDIVYEWCDGKGPLAAHFEAIQVKQLIRALFQNTEQRANVLAQIH